MPDTVRSALCAQTSQQPYEEGAIIFPDLQMTPKHEEGRFLKAEPARGFRWSGCGSDRRSALLAASLPGN